jgi:ketosteroid isomerase-like protein
MRCTGDCLIQLPLNFCRYIAVRSLIHKGANVTRPLGTLTVLALVACYGCVRSQPTAVSDADRAAIHSTVDSTLAIFNAQSPKDWAAYARSYYMEDAVSMPTNHPPLVGRAAIAAYESADSEENAVGYKERWQPIEIEGYHDLAYVRGRWWSWGGGSKPDSGKYLEIWRRQAAGNWRVARDMYSSDVPSPSPKSP